MNMTKESQNAELIKTIQKLTRFLRQEKINYDEFASNVIIHLVGQRLDEIEKCLTDLSEVEKAKLVEFARSYFAKNNFEPHPTVFMVDTTDASEVEKKRQELRPKYKQLLEDLEKVR